MNLDEFMGQQPEVFHRLVKAADARNTLIGNLQAARIAQGVTLEDLAERMGYPASFLVKIEIGEEFPHLTTLQHYAAAIGCEISLTITRTDQ